MVSAEITNKKNTSIFGGVLQSGKTYIYNIYIIYMYLHITHVYIIYIFIYLWASLRGKKAPQTPKVYLKIVQTPKTAFFASTLGSPVFRKTAILDKVIALRFWKSQAVQAYVLSPSLCHASLRLASLVEREPIAWSMNVLE
jgi:hypothetical protein